MDDDKGSHMREHLDPDTTSCNNVFRTGNPQQRAGKGGWGWVVGVACNAQRLVRSPLGSSECAISRISLDCLMEREQSQEYVLMEGVRSISRLRIRIRKFWNGFKTFLGGQ